MHFTREPIIESILSARDGYKLVLRNSKTASSAEISAEVIEIVSFAGTVFYRSQDRSRNFLLPAIDFEIVEVKDARLVLKNISLEKSSKLQNPPKETVLEEASDELHDDAVVGNDQEVQASATTANSSQNSRLERRRERRRNRRRRHNEEKNTEEKKDGSVDTAQEQESSESLADGGSLLDNVSPQPSIQIPTLNLIPPPTTLISQTLARYKEKLPEQEASNESPIVEEVDERKSVDVTLEPEDLV